MLLAIRTAGFSARRLVAALLFAMSPAVAQAPADCRVAIIIGNAAYPTAPLVNPANDAKSMAAALRNAGFEVFEVRNGGKAQMEEAIAMAGAALKGRRGVGMLYYAGHGIQLDLRDYLVPVDAQLRSRADVPIQAIDLQEVIDMFRSAGNRTNSENGLYTQFLVHELGVEGARIEDVFKRVRYQVRRKSAGRQIPWESTSLEDDFFFDPAASAKQALDGEKEFAIEKAEWETIKDVKVPEPLYAYLQKYPNGLVSESVQFRLDQLQKPLLEARPVRNHCRAGSTDTGSGMKSRTSAPTD